METCKIIECPGWGAQEIEDRINDFLINSGYAHGVKIQNTFIIPIGFSILAVLYYTPNPMGKEQDNGQ